MIIFINNKDSFVWNLVDYVSRFEEDTEVVSNTIEVEEIEEINPSGIIISPGPGTPNNPEDIGNSIDVVRLCVKLCIPVLGVCLGAQTIAVAFGGIVSHSPEGPIHGKSSLVYHDGKTIFRNVRNPLEAGRYHSLAILKVPETFEVSAYSNSIVMGIRSRKLPIEGVQFHPESVLTPEGLKIIENFVRMCEDGRNNKNN
jgi:anthranilate synthase component 2